MKNKITLFVLNFVLSFILSAIFISTSNTSLYALDVPPLRGYVNDYAKMLNASNIGELTNKLSDIEKTDSTQIVILTINSLQGEPIEMFSIKIADTWKIGQKNLDNGVILIAAKEDRQFRIEVGKGLEGVLTDVLCGRIISQNIQPAFAAENYAQGFNEAVDNIIAIVKGEYSNQGQSSNPDTKLIIFVLLIVLFMYIMKGINLKKTTSGITGSILVPIFGLILFSGLWFLLLIPLGFLLGFIAPFLPTQVKTHTNKKGGGFWGGGGGFGGGGFTGGGGGKFGGGGASGRW
jgi:uncharacterized protein